jgi:hypothetical protein
MIYHGGYKYLRIPYLFLKQKICISNKKWKNSVVGFTTIITNIWKSFSYSLSENKSISNKKWKKSMIGFITLWMFENPFPIIQVEI